MQNWRFQAERHDSRSAACGLSRAAAMLAVLCAALIGCDPVGGVVATGLAGCVTPNERIDADATIAALGANAVFVTTVACASGAGDGSAAAPMAGFSSTSTVTAGKTIVLLAGEYNEALNVSGGVNVVAAQPSKTRLRAAVTVVGAGASTLTGLVIEGSAGHGVRIEGADVTLGASIITATVASAAGAGHGVVVVAGGSLVLSGTAIVGAAGVGLLAKGAGSISIVGSRFSTSAC